MLKKLVIIEDNTQLIQFIKDFFKSKGDDYKVEGYSSGLEALQVIKNNKPDIVVIDLELDDIRGETLCVELRKVYSDLPLIILTGDKSQQSIINCLNSGADDYITKPFNAEEFLARVNARMRAQMSSSSETQVLTTNNLSLNLDTLEVTEGKQKISLTAKEFELLKYLLLNKGRVLTREKILYAVWGYTVEVDTRVVDVHIGKLRKKIEKGKKPIIESIRGFGYKINE
jgi:DNA-binding response OmpR family regulator